MVLLRLRRARHARLPRLLWRVVGWVLAMSWTIGTNRVEEKYRGGLLSIIVDDEPPKQRVSGGAGRVRPCLALGRAREVLSRVAFAAVTVAKMAILARDAIAGLGALRGLAEVAFAALLVGRAGRARWTSRHVDRPGSAWRVGAEGIFRAPNRVAASLAASSLRSSAYKSRLSVLARRRVGDGNSGRHGRRRRYVGRRGLLACRLARKTIGTKMRCGAERRSAAMKPWSETHDFQSTTMKSRVSIETLSLPTRLLI